MGRLGGDGGGEGSSLLTWGEWGVVKDLHGESGGDGGGEGSSLLTWGGRTVGVDIQNCHHSGCSTFGGEYWKGKALNKNGYRLRGLACT